MIEDNLIAYWENIIVCPSCKSSLKFKGTTICCLHCGNKYSYKNGVPNFLPNDLTEHQRSELDFIKKFRDNLRAEIKHIRTGKRDNRLHNCNWSWSLPWINDKTVNQNTKIVTIGGSIGDDLPHVHTKFKIDIDHLAHEYVKILPEIITGNVKHISGVSEQLPFPNEYADVVYSRNSLDHVVNPIKTLLEINRILKHKEGRFYLLVYYNSNFINLGESTIIDKDFLEHHVNNIFDVEWMEIKSPEAEHVTPSKKYSLPNNWSLGFLYAVCKKKVVEQPYDSKHLKEYEFLTTNFHAAIYHDQYGHFGMASKRYKNVINTPPFVETDKMRILYSKIRYFSLKNPRKLSDLFRSFSETNRDPFWWKIWVTSSDIPADLLRSTIRKTFHDQEIITYITKNIDSVWLKKLKRFIHQRPYFSK